MVLPESPPDDAQAPVVGFIDEIVVSLGMSDGGTMVLVDRAHPSRLGDLVRALMHHWPEVDVFTDARDIEGLAPGSVFVLVPREEDAEWLNLRRHIFADRRLKAVLWCSEATTVALARKAVDFFDWITTRLECVAKPAPFAVRGLLAAFQAEWPIVWTGSKEQADLKSVIHGAFPTEKISWVNGGDAYEHLVSYMKRPEIVMVRVDDARQLRRVRWAYAEARRKGRVLLVVSGLDCPGFWPLHDRMQDIAEARETLKQAGASAPGSLAALLDLEPEAVGFIQWRLIRGDAKVLSKEICTSTSKGLDPTIGLSQYTPSEMEFIAAESPFEFRTIFQSPNSTAVFSKRLIERSENLEPFITMKHGNLGAWALHATATFSDLLAKSIATRAWALEPPLRSESVDDVQWVAIGASAASLGEGNIASYWLKKSITYQTVFIKKSFRAQSFANYVNWKFAADFLKSIISVCLFIGALIFLPKPLGSLEIPLLSITGILAVIAVHLIRNAIRGKTFDKYHGSAFLRFLELRMDLIRSQTHHAADLLKNGDSTTAQRMAQAAYREVQSTLDEAHPLYEKSLLLLTSILMTNGKTREAFDLLKPRIASDAPISSPIALLSARLLARTGRAGDAVQILARLTGQTIVETQSLLPAKPTATSNDEPRLDRLLQCPAGELANDPPAHLALVDALLAQGRYPEALQIARKAAATFVNHIDAESKELRSRRADLERRL